MRLKPTRADETVYFVRGPPHRICRLADRERASPAASVQRFNGLGNDHKDLWGSLPSSPSIARSRRSETLFMLVSGASQLTAPPVPNGDRCGLGEVKL